MRFVEPDVMRRQIDVYFEEVKRSQGFFVGAVWYDEENPTLTGLALWLGYTSASVFERMVDDPRYTEVVQYGRLRLENWYEHLMQRNVPMAKMGLKRLGGWSDDTNVTHSFTFADMVAKAAKGRRELVEDEHGVLRPSEGTKEDAAASAVIADVVQSGVSPDVSSPDEAEQ